MRINFIMTVAAFVALFVTGIALLLANKLDSTSFLTYCGFLIIVFLALFFKDKIASLKFAGNEMQFIQEAKQDIREYLLDVFKTQLLTVAAHIPINVTPENPAAVNVDTLFLVYDKLKKYDLLGEANTELQKAAETVMYNQFVLLRVYAQQQIDYEGLESLPDKLAELEANKSFDWPDHFNIPEEQREPLYNEALEHVKAIEEILIEASSKHSQ